MPNVQKSEYGIRKSDFFRKGFTLLEVLISVGLIALVTALAIPNFRYFNKVQEVDGAATQLINVLKIAQSSARSRIECPSNQISTNWYVQMTASSYTLKSTCLDATTPTVYTSAYAESPGDLTTFQMSNDRCSAGETLTIFFSQYQTSYQCNTTAGTLWPITITLSGGGSTKKVIVQQGGIIRSE